MDKKLVPESTP